MNNIIVSNDAVMNYENNIIQISSQLDNLPRHILTHKLWSSTDSPVLEVKFSIAHTPTYIFLKYYVREENIRAVHTKCNGNVWEDSCVEFFIAFNEAGYYNFEFNCIGTTLLGYGKSKHERLLLKPEIISKIKRYSTIKVETESSIDWELTIAIPLEVFAYDEIESFQNIECKANFYKCGDKLPIPHFLAWNNIEYPIPNFHLPSFFGSLFFK